MGKRLIKTPKIYFFDTGLLSNLLRIKAPLDIFTHSIKGNLFENMIIAELVKRMYHKNEIVDIWFWRDSKGNEIDLLYSISNTLYITEIKSNQTIMQNQFKGLLYYENYANKADVIKQLVYAGEENQARKQVNVISWKKELIE